jgi:2-polyprenyl-3-methyl-5-hydroxy-6-metoxy-1,4-benzoquinol methylase
MTKKGANSLKLFKQFFGYFFNKVTPEHANASSSTIDNWFNSHAHEAVEQIKSDLISINSNEIPSFTMILDFGCGDGIMLASLANKLNVIGHGVDFTLVDKKSLKHIFSNNNSELNTDSINFYTLDKFNFKPAYDLVLSWSVIEHVLDLNKYFDEAIKLLKSNGLLYLQTWPLWNSSQGHHLFDVGLNAFEHIEFTDELKLFTHIERIKDNPAYGWSNLEIDFDNWKKAAKDSYKSCNRITIDEIQSCIEKYSLRLLFFKPYFEDANFNLIPFGNKWKDFAISGGRWILQKI